MKKIVVTVLIFALLANLTGCIEFVEAPSDSTSSSLQEESDTLSQQFSESDTSQEDKTNYEESDKTEESLTEEEQKELNWQQYKTSIEKLASVYSYDNSTKTQMLLKIEDGFKEMLKQYPNVDIDDGFVLGIAYLGYYSDAGTIGALIAEDGYGVIRSYTESSSDLKEMMDCFKSDYEYYLDRSLNPNQYTAGQYKVGVDIPEGEYICFAVSNSSGYFCVSSDANKDDILFNENFDYNSIITVYTGEYLYLSRCYMVPIDEVESLPLDSADMFKIGVHLAPGEYKVEATGSDSGYYCIYSSSRQDDIVANDFFEGSAYLTVEEGQYLQLSRCRIIINNEQ